MCHCQINVGSVLSTRHRQGQHATGALGRQLIQTCNQNWLCAKALAKIPKNHRDEASLPLMEVIWRHSRLQTFARVDTPAVLVTPSWFGCDQNLLERRAVLLTPRGVRQRILVTLSGLTILPRLSWPQVRYTMMVRLQTPKIIARL